MSAEERAAAAFGAWRERVDRGEDADPDDLIRAHPDIANELRRQFDALRAVARAFAAPARTAGLAGRTLGQWRLVGVLGSGGMGTVYGAQARAGAATAAVKVLHPHLLARAGFVERFEREAQIGRRVRHPGVVATLDAGAAEIDGEIVHYLVMEHVEGRTLRSLLDDAGRRGLPEALVRHVGREVARALEAVHAAGAVHRDLKPENVIVTPDQVVKLMDLGVARLRDETVRISETGAFVGSLEYGSPEQFGLHAEVDHRSDLFSLGVTLYELSTGVHPFRADRFYAVVRRILDETPRPAAELNPQLSPFLEELVRTLLAKDRGRRFASAEEVAGLLEAGEDSAWWRARSAAIRVETKRPLRRMRIPRETAVYGRDAELAKLSALFADVRSGTGRVVLIEGEAGIGKSRLVDEWVALLHQQGHEVNFLYGSYPPGGAATASGAFSTAWREHLGDDDDAVRAALPQTPLLAASFAAHLRGDASPQGAEPLTRESLQTVFVHATRSFAATRPTIVLIDDLHFAPDEGRALFAALALSVPGHRILLVGATRPGLDPKWLSQIERLGHASRLPLNRLSPKDLVRVLADSLKSAHLAEELAGRIATKSDGNPFFVFEILRGLREGQYLTRRPDGTWATTRLIAEIQVPSSIVELVQARVSDLGRADRNVLEAAACVGFEFDAALVGDVLGVANLPVLQTLGGIEKSHRLVRSVGRRFVFDHHQVMEVLYAGLSEPLREEYHAAIGAAIERRGGAESKEPGDLNGALCVDLAEHFLRGGQGRRALRYLDSALTYLMGRYLSDAVVRLADRALSAPGLLEGRRRCEVLLRKADRLNLLARRKEQAECLEEANVLAESDPALRAKARLAWGQYFKVANRPDDARAALSEAILLAKQVDDRDAEANATIWLANVLRGLGRHDEARSHLESALALGRETGNHRVEASVTAGLGYLSASIGRWEEARLQFERHRGMSLEMGDVRGEALASGNLGNVFDAFGRYDEALACHERHAALCRQIGDRVSEALATGNLGTVLTAIGRLEEAQSKLEQQLAISREIGDRKGEAMALVNLGPIWLQLGDPVRAREALSASAALCREIGARWPEGYALHGLAQVADAEGDAAGALRLHEEALALRRSNGFDGVVADSLLEVGALHLRAGDTDRARAAIGEAVALVRSQRRAQELALGLALLACLPDGNADEAVSALATAGPGVDSPRVRFLIWQATGGRAHLAEAKRLLDHLVAHAPADCRQSMLANVPLHREIAEAARANGV